MINIIINVFLPDEITMNDTLSINDRLIQLGKDLRQLRKQQFPSDTQDDFAARLMISRMTYGKMERGDPSASAINYFKALEVLGVADRLDTLFALPEPETSLLEGVKWQ